MNIGKAGLSDAVVDELKRRLKADRLVKVKLLPSARVDDDRRDLAATLAARTDSLLVEVRGGTVLLYRPRGHRPTPSA